MFVTLIALTLCFSTVLSQSTSTTEKIIDFLGHEKYNETASSNPGLIIYLEARLNYGYKIVDFNSDRMINYTVINQLSKKSFEGYTFVSVYDFIEMNNNGTLNILLFSFPSQGEENLIFKLGDTNQALIVYSTSHINSLLQN